MLVALLAAMTFAGSAHAAFTAPGTWDFNVESYVTDLTGVFGTPTWEYDYVLWYEQWNGTAWSAMGDSLSYSNPSEFHVHISPSNGILGWSIGDQPMALDNVNYNGAASWDFAFLGTSADPTDPGTIIAWDLTTGGSTRLDKDAVGWVDHNVPEAYDPSVRSVTNEKEAFLETWWGLPPGSAVLCPGSPTPYDPTNGAMTSLTGYNRPLGWFEFLSTNPPVITHADTVDGSQASDRVWGPSGPSPELNSLSLLIMSLVPAGALFRRRRKR